MSTRGRPAVNTVLSTLGVCMWGGGWVSEDGGA